MGCDQSKPTNNINKNVGNVTDSNNKVWNNCEISILDEKRQILEWLSPSAPRKRHRTVSESRVYGIGNCLLLTNEFKKWHTSKGQDVHPVLFCYGDPGVGKTYLSSLVIDTLCDAANREDVVVACVYCDFHAHEGQSATGVLAALLKQFVATMETIPTEISEAFERAKREVDGRALQLPEIRAMLVKSLTYLPRGFICIDALDEFPTKHRPGLWDSLQHIIRECPGTRLFMTGRQHIREEVKKYFPGYPDLPSIKPTEQDIREYITMRLGRDPVPDAMDTRLEADILRAIPEKVSGIFLLVTLIMDAVLEEPTIHQRRQTLHKMTNGLGLDDAYSTTLSRIRKQKGNKGKLGMQALMWISHSERPLKAEELCHALAVEAGSTDLNFDNVPSIGTLLSCTLGLVTINEQESTVRLVHSTLQEYLAAHPNLFTTPHLSMAEICLTYLNFRSICELSTTLDTVPSTTPFLHYASCYWGFHARKRMTKGVKCLALRHLQRDANHISASILLREQNVGFLSWWCRYEGRNPDLRGFTGLHCVSYMGITNVVIYMVNIKRWDLNGCDSNDATPLIWAAKYGNWALAKLLLKQGDVNPTLSDKYGLTALTHAAKAGEEKMVSLLLKREDVNPDFPDKYARTPLSYAAESGAAGVVRLLLKRKDVNPDSSDRHARTPLSYSTGSASESVVKILLGERDVNSSSPDKHARTPLSYAAQSGSRGVVELLLKQRDVNPDSPDKHVRTPLSYAAQSGHVGVVELLLRQRDVNPDLPDKHARTPLSYAAQSGHDGMVKLLLKQTNVNPDPSDKHARTPLSYAAQSGHEGVVEILLQQEDVNPSSSDKRSRTPLSYATRSGHQGVVELLERLDLNQD